jgi:D-alanyl-D-alanine carboxypeptidase
VATSGFGDVASRQAITTDDVMRIASISKAFSGAVALSLVSQKKLSLSDTIGKRLPTLPEAWHSVTLAELLNHTSGLPDYIKNPQFLEAFKANPQISLTPTQLLGYVADEPLLFPPGSRYDYSDSDNIAVGLMVESVTDGPYSSALADYVTTPLHLADTALPTTTALSEPYIHGYDVEPGKAPDDISMLINPGLAWASGGMVSTPAELNAFMRAYVSGVLFAGPTRTSQFQFVPGSSGPPGPGTNAAGLGIYRYETSCGTVYGHTGNLPGYTLFAASSRDGEDSALVVINEQLNSNPVTAAFTRLRQTEESAVCAALRS